MDKKEVVAKLQKKGYAAQLEGDVPVIRTNDKTLSVLVIQKEMLGLGYNGSFGIKHMSHPIGSVSLESEGDMVLDGEVTDSEAAGDLDNQKESSEVTEEASAVETSSLDEDDDAGLDDFGMQDFDLTESIDGQMSFF